MVACGSPCRTSRATCAYTSNLDDPVPRLGYLAVHLLEILLRVLAEDEMELEVACSLAPEIVVELEVARNLALEVLLDRP